LVKDILACACAGLGAAVGSLIDCVPSSPSTTGLFVNPALSSASSNVLLGFRSLVLVNLSTTSAVIVPIVPVVTAFLTLLLASRSCLFNSIALSIISSRVFSLPSLFSNNGSVSSTGSLKSGLSSLSDFSKASFVSLSRLSFVSLSACFSASSFVDGRFLGALLGAFLDGALGD
jgi:hypothetical protein